MEKVGNEYDTQTICVDGRINRDLYIVNVFVRGIIELSWRLRSIRVKC